MTLPACVLFRDLDYSGNFVLDQSFHTIVIGGGCLGTAAAISIAKRISRRGHAASDVCVIDKMVVGSGLSARHSGIVRAANADSTAAVLAQQASEMWANLETHWGVGLNLENTGALWIACDTGGGANAKWSGLQQSLREQGIDFSQLSLAEARQICPDFVRLNDDEVFFHEPGAFQVNPSNVRETLYSAIKKNGITLLEKTEVQGFERGESGEVSKVVTSAGTFKCTYVINASGPWSPAIFAGMGLSIPVSVEPVHVANWLTSLNEMEAGMPIIADYVNLAYFRQWRDGEIHMHQPRKRGIRETARAFSESPLSVLGADFMNDPTNQALGYSQMRVYEELARRRFSNMDQTVYGSGYRSFFDITPDLRFILGPDHRVPNLIHSLGSGQAFKYAPVLGEMMAQYVDGGGPLADLGQEFSISRFSDGYMAEFWSKVQGTENVLQAEGAGL